MGDIIQILSIFALGAIAVRSMRMIFVSQKKRDHVLGIVMYTCALAITITMVFVGGRQ